jgi:hypothetical protein
MNYHPTSRNARVCVTMASIVAATLAVTAHAAPIEIEILLTPKSSTKLELVDDSHRYMLASQREGQAIGSGPLAGTATLDWGVHDVQPGVGAIGRGYLVFTAAEGDIAYVKYEFHAQPMPSVDGKPFNLLNGVWEMVGGTGRFKAVHGAGTTHIDVVPPNDRKWRLVGDLVSASQVP